MGQEAPPTVLVELLLVSLLKASAAGAGWGGKAGTLAGHPEGPQTAAHSPYGQAEARAASSRHACGHKGGVGSLQFRQLRIDGVGCHAWCEQGRALVLKCKIAAWMKAWIRASDLNAQRCGNLPVWPSTVQSLLEKCWKRQDAAFAVEHFSLVLLIAKGKASTASINRPRVSGTCSSDQKRKGLGFETSSVG